jgi:hypothetical protein
MKSRFFAILFSGLLSAGTAAAQETAPARPAQADPNKFAVIVSGASGEEAYAKQFQKWTSSLRGALVERLGFSESRVAVLTEKPGDAKEAPATADGVRRAFAEVKGAAGPDSTVFVFLIGHGSFDGRAAKLSLVGPDLAASEYAKLVGELNVRRVVVFNMASASGEFIKALAGRGRIVVTATRSGQEQNATRFAEHFIAALDSREADADQNGRVSVLEAYKYAARLTADYYTRAGRLATEHPLIEDNGDGVGTDSEGESDGAVARNTYFDSLNAEQAAASAEVGRLMRERERFEEEIEQLKTRKRAMQEAAYEAELERLFVGLAKVNRSIKRAAR